MNTNGGRDVVFNAVFIHLDSVNWILPQFVPSRFFFGFGVQGPEMIMLHNPGR